MKKEGTISYLFRFIQIETSHLKGPYSDMLHIFCCSSEGSKRGPCTASMHFSERSFKTERVRARLRLACKCARAISRRMPLACAQSQVSVNRNSGPSFAFARPTSLFRILVQWKMGVRWCTVQYRIGLYRKILKKEKKFWSINVMRIPLSSDQESFRLWT